MLDDLPRLAYLALLLVAIGGFLIVELRARPGQTLRQVAAWGLIFAGTVAVAGLWKDISGVVAPRQQILEGGGIEIPVSDDGHYYLRAQLDGTSIDFVVDTGATTIALTKKDAAKIGIDTANLAFISQARTANGTVNTAPVVIQEIRIGEIEDHKVPAVVIDGEMDQSLLGMNYLSRFARVSIEGDKLLLER
ncbi:retropepsin-like aspartic protease family protein [Paracoccus aminophilus]|uniref:Aspartyl protease family protein n=1 Tax=Paracoccus aminophilus JCM 7686 TaxID=1367847 RepID=S5XRV7_PARAH|nr:TIGR02281 family clan AA aspartic protease [Paracoccus aminophilus]AGT07847.1 aspartyl protease family protein [Paracoccus aminophilus JCM 7686]